MVVQWEDRFHGGNRAHTYLGPVDHPEYTGGGVGRALRDDLSRLRGGGQGFGIEARQIRRKEDVGPALRAMIAHPGPYVLDVLIPLPGTRPG